MQLVRQKVSMLHKKATRPLLCTVCLKNIQKRAQLSQIPPEVSSIISIYFSDGHSGVNLCRPCATSGFIIKFAVDRAPYQDTWMVHSIPTSEKKKEQKIATKKPKVAKRPVDQHPNTDQSSNGTQRKEVSNVPKT